jgi:hypothetical protein
MMNQMKLWSKMSKVTRTPVKYVTNKELLAEIARCKNTFCTFTSPEYANYDAIVGSMEILTPEFITETLDRLNVKAPEPKTRDGMIFRVMSYDHVPIDPERKRKSRVTNMNHARTNFPPFKHCVLRVIDGQDTFEEVGRSHWEGDFETGRFTIEKGRMSERLGRMFMMLVEKYSMRSNWRGYCYDTDTELLTQRGWLNHDEITMDDIAMAYNQEDGHLVWSKINHIYRNHYTGNMFKLEVRGLDALVTPGHKFITQDGLKPAELLKETDKLTLMGKGVKDDHTSPYPDAFVELVGWVVTEGCFYERDNGTTRLTICQNEGDYADRIRACLNTLGYGFSEYSRTSLVNKNVAFTLNKDLSHKMMEVIVGGDRNKKILSTAFINSLTQDQRELLINTMIDGDGWRTVQNDTVKIGYCQKDKEHMDAFAMLCTIAGKQVAISPTPRMITQKSGKITPIYEATVFSDKRRISRVENVNMHGAKRNGTIKGRGKHTHPNIPTVPYDGKVWCVSSDYGTLVVRRGRYIYTCSNTYRDEMCGLALTHLSQVGLQFDESKSNNPFAFFTTTLTHSFTRTLNLEKKNQSIRDDLLVNMGMNPSYTRQIENEMGQSEPKKAPAKRGRKSAATIAAEAAVEKARKASEEEREY